MKQRFDHIDVAKGIAIILIAIFHAELARNYYWIDKITSFIPVPVFFFLSGVFFSCTPNFSSFVVKKSDSILKPYFVTLFALFFAATILTDNNWQQELIGIFYSSSNTIRWPPMWFLSHLFLLFLSSYILYRYAKFDKVPWIIKTLLIITVFFIATHFIGTFKQIQLPKLNPDQPVLGLPFGLDLLLLSSVFFVSGIELKDYVKQFKPHLLLLLATLGICAVILFLSKTHMDFNARFVSTSYLAAIGSLSGIYAVLCLSVYACRVSWLKSTLNALGQGSLFVLIFHSTVSYNIQPYLYKLIPYESLSVIPEIIAVVVSLAIPMGIRWVAVKIDFVGLFYLPVAENSLMQRLRK